MFFGSVLFPHLDIPVVGRARCGTPRSKKDRPTSTAGAGTQGTRPPPGNHRVDHRVRPSDGVPSAPQSRRSATSAARPSHPPPLWGAARAAPTPPGRSRSSTPPGRSTAWSKPRFGGQTHILLRRHFQDGSADPDRRAWAHPSPLRHGFGTPPHPPCCWKPWSAVTPSSPLSAAGRVGARNGRATPQPSMTGVTSHDANTPWTIG